MTVRAVGNFEMFTGVDTTTPYEGGVSTSGGAVAAGGTITFPNVTKTTTGGRTVFRYGARAAASGYSAWGVGDSGWTGYTTSASGGTASPNLAEQVYGKGYETSAAAAGTITGPTIALTTGHAASSWAARGSVLRGISSASPAFVARSAFNTQDSAGVIPITLTGQTNNAFFAVEMELDDPTAVLTMPDGTWHQAFSQAHANGVLVGLYKFMPSSGTPSSATYNFPVTITVSPPSNTAAPTISGTAAVGSTLSTTNGTWTNSPTSFAYVWKRDGVAISGATASTYTVTSADAGHALRSNVAAANSGGSSTAVASTNSITIPSAPVNTVAPVVTTDGTPATGETISVNTGTWSNSPDSYAYQWYRGSSPITGATASTYALVVTDEGANIRCDVTATNGGGSATASSNVIVPAVTAAISDASFLDYYSGGAGNTNPALSIGGARGGTFPGGLNALFGPVIGTVAQSGGVFYAVVYVRNTHTTSTAAGGAAYIETQFPTGSGLDLAVAVPAEAVNVTVAALASNTTAPAGVTWSNATDPATGLSFGNLAPGDYRGLYVRLTVTAGATRTTEADAGWAIQFSAA